MFRTLIYPSSGACDCAVELPHRSFCSRLVVCWRFGAAGFAGCPCCKLKSACNMDTTQTQPHQISNTQRTENKRTDVVIQQHNRKLLMMAILMSETCWIHNKWTKIASDIKLVFYSSPIWAIVWRGEVHFIWIYLFLFCGRSSLPACYTCSVDIWKFFHFRGILSMSDFSSKKLVCFPWHSWHVCSTRTLLRSGPN